MGVVGSGIAVGGDHHLEAVAPQPPGQLHADLVGQFGIHFSGLEALIAVVAEPAVLLVPHALRQQELLRGGLHGAVDAGHIFHALGLRIVCGVLHHPVDDMQGGLPGEVLLRHLLRVLDIGDHLVHAALDGPERCHSHFISPPRCDRILRFCPPPGRRGPAPSASGLRPPDGPRQSSPGSGGRRCPRRRAPRAACSLPGAGGC